MNVLSELLNLPETEKIARGLAHTPREIAQQPDTWVVTCEVFKKNRPEIAAFLARAGFAHPSSGHSSHPPTVFLVGAGTSDYIGQSLTHLLRMCWGCEVFAVPSTDLLTHMEDILIPDQKYLWISFSRSGESPEGVAVLEKARKIRPDISHLIVSCNAQGRMIRESENQPQMLGICLDDAVNDRGLAMTSSFTNMVVFGQCLAHINDLVNYEEIFPQLVEAGRKFLPLAADCAAAVAEGTFTRACFVGSGALRAVARESALKLLEMTAGKIVTMSESVLGLRHGPMAALDQETLFVCFLSSNPLVRQYEIDLLDEIAKKHLAKTRIVIGGESATASRFDVDQHLAHLESGLIPDEYRPPLDVMFGQLLGLLFSLHCNLQPDRPSPNGAISRVVEKFSIHE